MSCPVVLLGDDFGSLSSLGALTYFIGNHFIWHGLHTSTSSKPDQSGTFTILIPAVRGCHIRPHKRAAAFPVACIVMAEAHSNHITLMTDQFLAIRAVCICKESTGLIKSNNIKAFRFLAVILIEFDNDFLTKIPNEHSLPYQPQWYR